MYNCFASTNRGLEKLLMNELTTLGAQNLTTVNAGVLFKATMPAITYMNLHSRLASRILLQLGSAPYQDETDIYNFAYSIDYTEWFDVDHTFKVFTSAIKSPLRSLEFITLKVKDAICDNFMHKYHRRPDINKQQPDVKIYNFLNETSCTIYLDTSGEALFKRGYRTQTEEAPIKENLAAGIIKLSNWNYTDTLLDPMCGSGTIIIEGVMMALNIAPGLKRNFAFEKFNNFYQHEWDEMKRQAKSNIKTNQKLNIYAHDINSTAIYRTEQNLRHAQLREYVSFNTADVLTLTAPTTSGILISNLPYGVRVDTSDPLTEFYPKLATQLKRNFHNWTCYLLSANLLLPKLMRLKPSKKTPLFNGPLECRLYELNIVAGSNRQTP